MVILDGCLGSLTRKRLSSMSNLREPQSTSLRLFYPPPVISRSLRSYEHGVNTFDTANIYSNGVSEVYLGRAIKALDLPRDEIVVMTKLFAAVAKSVELTVHTKPAAELDEEGYVNQHGLSRKHIFDSVKKSLDRLQLEYIDVLQCHRFDPDTPIEETMQALHDVVKAGYVRYIGMSSCYAWQFHIMQNYAITHNLTPFISMQNHHSLVYREEEREMFPTLKHFGVGIIPWSPLARGLLTRPVEGGKTTARSDSATWTDYLKGPGTLEIINRVEEISKKHGISMAQVSLAWSLTRVTAPIIGSTSIKKLEELISTCYGLVVMWRWGFNFCLQMALISS
jgi:aryl-alcohol dehydrogenase-like predicted oxidoreductase